MRQIFIFLLSLACMACLAPHAAKAATHQQAYSWHGPGCNYDALNWAICSIDPPPPPFEYGNISPCYRSYTPNPTPTAFDLADVGLCQAAKSALDAPPAGRIHAANWVAAWYDKFMEECNENPMEAFIDIMASAIPKDMAAFNADMAIYNLSRTDQNWQPVINDLEQLSSDASITDGL